MADLIDRAATTAIVMEECYKDREMKLASRIEARLAALPAQGLRVKPLEWIAIDDDDCDCEAYGCGLRYWIVAVTDHQFTLSCGGIEIKDCPTLDAAKATAQADYERRILAALEPASGGVEATNMQKVHNAPAPVDATSRHYDRQADGKVREIVFVDEPPLEALVKAAEGARWRMRQYDYRAMQPQLEALDAALASFQEEKK